MAPRNQRAVRHVAFKVSKLPDGTHWLSQYRRKGGFLLRFPALADFALDHSASVASCWPVPGTTAATIDHLFLNQVVPLAMSQRGQLVLHGSAVNAGDAALAFLGDSGQGKSTLAGDFAANGLPFLTDDGLLIDLGANGARVVPGHRSIRLWADSEATLVPTGARKADAVQFSSKSRFYADDVFQHCDAPCALRCLYLLRNNGPDAVKISPIPAAVAFMQLVNQSFLLDTESTIVLTRHFEQLKTLLGRTPVFSLDYPRDYSQLPAVRSAITAHAASLTLPAG